MRKAAIALVVLGIAAFGAFAYRTYVVNELRKPVLAKLSDPDSAKFRGETLHGDWTVNGSFICGEVNAKNRMGGYVGYVPFWAAFGEHADVGSDELMADVVKAQCDI